MKVLALVWLLLGQSAFAGSEHVTLYLEASARFEALVAQGAQERRMPRATEAQAADVIATLSDTQRFLNSTTYRPKDLPLLTDMCGKANAAVMAYALFDLKAHIDQSAKPQVVAVQLQRLMERNVHTFQEELSRLQPFLVRCMATQIPLLEVFVSSLKPEEMTDIRRAGLQKARMGTFAMYVGVLESARATSLGESYRQNLLEALAETASAFAPSLQLTERSRILDFVKAVRPIAPSSFDLYLGKISEAMSDVRCDGLCRF